MVVNELAVKKILDELNDVKLIAATKYVGIDEINKLENLGVMYFGENRVQAFLEKYQKYNGNCKFHMIGTLQPNKVKYIIDKVDLIHSVDSYSLIKEIEKQANKHNLVMKVLIQVNISKEESKHGFKVEEIEEVFDTLKNYPNIEAEKTREYFKLTQDLFNQLKIKYPEYSLTELSMGMSNDYKIALEYGATMVRIGSSLFK